LREDRTQGRFRKVALRREGGGVHNPCGPSPRRSCSEERTLRRMAIQYQIAINVQHFTKSCQTSRGKEARETVAGGRMRGEEVEKSRRRSKDQQTELVTEIGDRAKNRFDFFYLKIRQCNRLDCRQN